MKKIFDAALNNKTLEIKEYLRFGNVNLKDENKNSLLHYAAMGNAIEVANLLLDNYANLNSKNNKGETPLFYAVNKGEIGFARLLCRYGADINVLNEKGESLYFRAVLKGKREIIDLLQDLGKTNYELVTKDLENILFYALKAYNNKLFISLANKYPNLLNQIDCNGLNLMMLAIKNNNLEIFNYLYQKELNIYYSDFLNNNILFYASRYGSVDILKLLLDKKPIIEGKNKDGQTIMDLAELNSYPTSILLDNYKNSYDYLLYKKTYPFHIAVLERNYDLLEHLKDIKKRDINGLLIIDLIKMVNDKIINKMFNIKA